VFDPERDQDDGHPGFYLRLLAVAVISAAGCLALWPSVTGFAAGLDGEKGCVAVIDGWHSDRGGMSAADRAVENLGVGPNPSAQQLSEIERANERLDWIRGPGACIPQSRHRLIRSGLGLLGLGGFVGGVTYFRRTRENLRRPPAELAGV
jgi:hypothetical protein